MWLNFITLGDMANAIRKHLHDSNNKPLRHAQWADIRSFLCVSYFSHCECVFLQAVKIAPFLKF